MSAEIMPFKGGNKFILVCDFCARLETQVSVLIASAGGKHICNECVGVCVSVIAARKNEEQGE